MINCMKMDEMEESRWVMKGELVAPYTSKALLAAAWVHWAGPVRLPVLSNTLVVLRLFPG